ncbi:MULTISPECIES: hypothetical protein [Pseudomonas]|jgi:hypothetical protein|uniref:Uncharacterized protein n=3 Tax=Pseudomonas TaxID=286 RepID=A0A7M2JAQ9_PSEFL|nr:MULTISPECIES: hypothetical protein [Pseudomonas]AHC32795.1 hypothetical protein U771_01155 [Pseudomonas sp. TKP]MBL1305661.1 hypothetical protein [Pseudomonas sp.]MDR6581019.1 hypothetical protein [Pseudomonas extremaustralis]PMX15856.1 hypothetical protein C1Y25_10465 [Pseudomonas sp. MPBC4-3]PMX39903.1 hypothetical protein C1Y20_31735 [Pseudomonas sp. FW301-21B01]
MVQEFNHHREWVAALDKYEKRLIENPDLRWEGQPRDQHTRMALGLYKLKCFAERMRKDSTAIWTRLEAMDELRLHLISEHHWTLQDVRRIQDEEDFVFLLHDELQQMKLTEQEAEPVRQWTDHLGSRGEFQQHYRDCVL